MAQDEAQRVAVILFKVTEERWDSGCLGGFYRLPPKGHSAFVVVPWQYLTLSTYFTFQAWRLSIPLTHTV